MVEIRPLRIEIEREEDGRFLASVPELPGVMAYGDIEESALRRAKAIALQVLADMMESGEELPHPPAGPVCGVNTWSSIVRSEAEA
jgi:predicted RNase H-like HicB family nuclease